MATVSKEVLSIAEDKVKIHGLRTGKLAIKKSAMDSAKPGTLSTLLSFRDKTFGEWLPVWVWVIEHPEGTFLVDTGLSTSVNRKDYFKGLDPISRYYFKKQMKFSVEREEELDVMLSKIGVDSIDKVILTHLHIDHTGGLKHLSNVPILVNETEWETKDGSFPELFPPSANIQTIKLDSQYETFENCYYLTKRKDIVVIQTPGHTRGHVSVALVGSNNKVYLFAGDVAYNKKRLTDKTFSATIKSRQDNINSCNEILELAKNKDIVFLPTHDSGAAETLKNDEILS